MQVRKVLFNLNSIKMKVTAKFFGVIIFLSLAANFSFLHAQKGFEGTIEYKWTVSGDNAEMMQAYMPQSMSIYMKGDNVRTELKGGMSAMFGNVIYKGSTDKSYMLVNNGKEKIAYEMVNSDTSATMNEKLKVEDMNQTETILGYTCKKYRVDTGGGMAIYSVTDEITVNQDYVNAKKKSQQQGAMKMYIEGIKGFPLKITMSQNQGGMSINMEMAAINVDKSSPASDLFEIPKDYTVKKFSQEEMQKMMFGR